MRTVTLALFLLPTLAAADIKYTLTPIPASKAVAVTVTPDKPGASEIFRIPAWCPGFYFLQSYPDKMFDVKATDATGKALTIEKVDKDSWKVSNPDRKAITFSYKVQGDDDGQGFFGVSVKADKAFTNGAATFVYVDGRKDEETQLAVKLPEKWDIATGMTPVSTGNYTAGGYDEFIDHPIQMGAMTRRSFKIGDLDFDVVIASDNPIRFKIDEQTTVLKKVSEEAVKLFHGAPFKHYVYILHLTNAGFLGGLEHRGSTCIAMPDSAGLDYTTLAAHEFFHTWNVKNLRPKVLGPFDYTKECRTGNLWFAEGVTDYYANMNAYRSGLREAKWLYRTMGSEIGALQRGKTRLTVTLEDACKQTWESGGFGFNDLDYYNKGCVAGFVFDAAIRGGSDKSLDDVMRSMYAVYRLPSPGYEEDGVRKAMNGVSGLDLTSLYNTVVRSTQEVPYDGMVGIGLRVLDPTKTYQSAGFSTLNNVIDSVTEAGSTAGLKVGDEVVGYADGKLSIKRDGTAMTMPLALKDAAAPARYTVEENPLATAGERAKLSQFLAR